MTPRSPAARCEDLTSIAGRQTNGLAPGIAPGRFAPGLFPRSARRSSRSARPARLRRLPGRARGTAARTSACASTRAGPEGQAGSTSPATSARGRPCTFASTTRARCSRVRGPWRSRRGPRTPWPRCPSATRPGPPRGARPRCSSRSASPRASIDGGRRDARRARTRRRAFRAGRPGRRREGQARRQWVQVIFTCPGWFGYPRGLVYCALPVPPGAPTAPLCPVVSLVRVGSR